MKLLLTCLLSVVSSAAIACAPEAAMRREAVRTLYSNADLVRYVCVENGEYDPDVFAAQLAVNNVSLGSHAPAAIQIEPLRKGSQYFSAIFQLAQCKYDMVFAPDTTLSDVKLLKQQKNNYYILCGGARVNGGMEGIRFCLRSSDPPIRRPHDALLPRQRRQKYEGPV